MAARRMLVTRATEFLGTPVTSALAAANPGCVLFCQDAAFAEEKRRAAFLEAVDVKEAGRVQLVAAETAQEVAAAVGQHVDVLVNNDAFPAERRQASDVTAEALNQALQALTVFPFELTSKLLPAMQERKNGKVIFLTSATPFRGLPNYSAYVIARGATNAMARTLALEVARDNVQVNAVAPNFIESPTYFPAALLEDPATHAKIVKPIPLQRLGRPEEPAHLVAFLASNKADYITGQVMPFAGGWC